MTLTHNNTKYFGVITNRDYIYWDGERRPFWEFLDVQPDGWLTSLAYKKHNIPRDQLQLWDCGAWTYRKETIPKLGGDEVTPTWALQQYQAHAAPSAFVIAPDHILIEGVDINARRAFNETSARAFLPIAREAGLRPMAAIHGMDSRERLNHAQRLLDMGYEALAVGGVAARASQRTKVLEMVQALREETRGTWLHVLGLSAPSYMQEWYRLGIDSCDGSSHFKQAFTAGAFYVHDEGKLIREQAARVDRDSGDVLGDVPDYFCECRACRMLRERDIDTRTYGSNENNMGRAAHNLNMLIQAHQYVAMDTVHLVSCVSLKKGTPAPAAQLYQSPWFHKARSFVEVQETPWHVLSAAHGVLDPDTTIEPYDQTLNKLDAASRRRWAQDVADQLRQRYRKPTRFVILAGHAYRDKLIPMLESAGHACEVPMKGLGIGQQLSWLNHHIARQLPLFN